MLDFKKIRKKNICLIGLMGSGKSIIGKELSNYYKLDFYDSDNIIVENIGKSINNIFYENGEKYFREIEEKICMDLLNNKNCIISLGGGSIINKNVRNKIKNNSYAIYLKVDIDILSKRLQGSNKRPIIKNENIKDKLNEIYKNRKNYYNQADIIIENNFNKKKIIEDIKKILKYK